MTIVFDLDDTLFDEIEFVKSSYQAIADFYGQPELKKLMLDSASPHEAFERAAIHLNLSDVGPIIDIYRTHYPSIKCREGVISALNQFKNHGATLGLITDGRSLTQRNKIQALGLTDFLSDRLIVISEEIGADKLSTTPFEIIERRAANPPYYYIADNPAKDFLRARQMGWITIMILDSGHNIHQQNLHSLLEEYHPDMTAQHWSELPQMICS